MSRVKRLHPPTVYWHWRCRVKRWFYFGASICIQLLLKKRTFGISHKILLYFVRASLWVPCRTNSGLIKVEPLWRLPLTYLPSLEVASSDYMTCTKRSAPNKDHITDATSGCNIVMTTMKLVVTCLKSTTNIQTSISTLCLNKRDIIEDNIGIQNGRQTLVYLVWNHDDHRVLI